MAYIQQSPSLLSNSAQVTTSFWFRVPAVAALQTQFGSSFGATTSLFCVNDINADYYLIQLAIGVTSGSVSSLTLNLTCSEGTVSTNWRSLDSTDTSFGISPITYSNPPNSIALGSWNHLFLATDTTNATKVLWMFCNGVCHNRYEQDDFPGATLSTCPQFDHSPDSGYACGLGSADVGIPANSFQRASDSAIAIDYADFQMWVGKFVDPTAGASFALGSRPSFATSVSDNFFKVANGIGTPVDPAVAASAYGEQTLLHMGDKDHFWINRGTGGTFTKVGTLSDFTPTPSYSA